MLRDLSDTHFPKAKKIVLMKDNLNTHKPASLYEAFPAAEARKLVERFKWSSLHARTRQLAQHGRDPNSACCRANVSIVVSPIKQTLTEAVAAREDSRNKKHVKADWQFTTADARVKLKRLYPAMWTNRGTSLRGPRSSLYLNRGFTAMLWTCTGTGGHRSRAGADGETMQFLGSAERRFFVPAWLFPRHCAQPRSGLAEGHRAAAPREAALTAASAVPASCQAGCDGTHAPKFACLASTNRLTHQTVAPC